ncbi:hypothetical protein [Mesorhizobium sp. WSM1293]|uniref:hypothetical protein n=1 Tax=Mesorhizobium sp. WSM1293 TaxID=1040984 RepID=UPI0004B6C43A|nr:hypothetical protein [Mesorhizobium sp. WSM1293]
MADPPLAHVSDAGRARLALIPDSHEGYVSWERAEAIRKMVSDNVPNPLPALRPQADGPLHGHQAQHSALFLLAGSARQW